MTVPTTSSAPPTGTAGSAAQKLQHGVDVAVFQGEPSTWASQAGDIDWAAVKLTELEPKNVRYVNPDAAADWSSALGKQNAPRRRAWGGDVVSAVASARWPHGQLVVAGLGKDGYLQVTRWDNRSWSRWKVVSPGRSTGAPGLLAWPSCQGRLFYVDESGAVIEMDTTDSRQTWS
jgi:hypothetical protein